MRCILSFLIILVFLLAGCSGGSSKINELVGTPIPGVENETNQSSTLYTGTFDIDLDSMTIIQGRSLDTVYNITGFLPDKCPGGCFRFRIVNIIGTVLEIELTVENPTLYQVYDLRIEYLNLYGKVVLNPDSYTDFLSTPISGANPFTAFAKESPDRAFPVGPSGIDTEILFLDFPAGSQASVDYAITASLPGNCLEPYEISDMMQSGQLSPSGGSATISCRVKDHQDNVSVVYLDAVPFTGVPKVMVQNTGDPELYEVTFSNTSGAPIGSSIQLIMAMSPNSQSISTYNYVEITVSGGTAENPIAVINTTPDPPEVGVRNPEVIFDGSDSFDPDGGAITLYEWDFDWDGIPANFFPEVSTSNAIINYTFSCYPADFTVGLRVTDDDTPAGVSEIESVLVTVFDDASEGSWDGANQLGIERIHGDTVYTTAEMIHVDSTGLVHLISVSGNNEILHRTFDGVTIADPETAFLSPNSISMATSLIDSNDELHVFWAAQVSLTRGNVYHSQTVNGEWTGVSDLLYEELDTDYFNTCLTVGINIDDHMMATWINYDWDKVDVHYMYALDTGSGFAPAADMPYEVHIRAATGPNPSYLTPGMNLVTTPDGKFHYFAMSYPGDLSGYGTIYQHVFNYGDWAPKRYVYGTFWGIVHPQVVAENDGDIHLSVRIPPISESNMRYFRYDSISDTWADPLYVAWDARGFQYGDVEVDDAGFIYVTYCSNVDNLLRMKVFCEHAGQAELDSIPTQMVDTTHTYHDDIDTQWHDGVLYALYQSFDGTDRYLNFDWYTYN